MEEIPIDILDEFKSFTQYDVEQFLVDYVNFADNHYNNIYTYYSGESDVRDSLSFDELKRLIGEQMKITDIFTSNSKSLTNYGYWILLEKIEDIGLQLGTTSNLSRWLRSSKISGDLYNTSLEREYTAIQGQSLEQIEQDVSSSTNSQGDWVDTALRNELAEEDYNVTEGGYLLKISFKNRSSIFLGSVVDNIDSIEKTYGLDINRVLLFENDDLKVLSPKETILQAAEILSDLHRGDNPFHLNDGIDERIIIGSTIMGIAYPIVFRQLADTFGKDDTFASISIIDVTNDSDSVLIEFEVETRAGELLAQQVAITK